MSMQQLHESHGVRWDGAGDARLPRNYGDPAAEYDAARNAAVVIDRSDRRIIRVHGRDPMRMVQGLVSNDVHRTLHDLAVYATVLSPKGRMVADTRIVKHGDELLLETDAAAAEALAAHLRKFVPPLFARFEDASDAWVIIGVHGPRARNAVETALGLVIAGDFAEDVVQRADYAAHVEAEPAAHVTVDGMRPLVITTTYAGVDGYDVLCARAAQPSLWQRLVDAGARPMGHATLDVLRIEAGSPRWGAELTDSTIPLEAGLRRRAISETKGCYTGQEVIVRILHRGHVNWHLRHVHLGDVAAPAGDTPLYRAGEAKQVGRITSAAWSPLHAQAIALAYVRREVEPPAALRLGSPDGPEVAVHALPGDPR